jgi:hypothetical protein
MYNSVTAGYYVGTGWSGVCSLCERMWSDPCRNRPTVVVSCGSGIICGATATVVVLRLVGT